MADAATYEQSDHISPGDQVEEIDSYAADQ